MNSCELVTYIESMISVVVWYISVILYLQACDRLLAHRVEIKMKTKKVTDVANRLHVAVPVKRDHKVGKLMGTREVINP